MMSYVYNRLKKGMQFTGFWSLATMSIVGTLKLYVQMVLVFWNQLNVLCFKSLNQKDSKCLLSSARHIPLPYDCIILGNIWFLYKHL